MKKQFIVFLLLAGLCSSASAKDTLFIGPTHLRVSEDGKISAAPVQTPKETFDQQWAYHYYPTDKKLTGKGVTVAVADSGISSHIEFNGKNIQGQDFTLSPSIEDLKNHGTSVAGIIGARGVNFKGVAPAANLLVYKIDDGSRLIGPQAVAAAVNTLLAYNEAHPDQKIAVLNLSYGVSNGGYVPLTNAINRAYETGVVVVCPAGNLGFPGVHYPANLSTTIAVGALAADGQHAYPNSSYGPEVDFIAPGDRVYSTANDGGYTLMSGSSASAGFVSAAAALAVEGLKKKLGRYPTVPEVKESLQAAAVAIPGISPLQQGRGLIDVTRLEKQFFPEK